MAQTGYTPILIYSSSTASNVPSAGNLTNSTLGSELAINITDGKLFYKDNANVVQVIGWKVVPTSAGGTGLTSYTAGDLIYYASGTAFTKLAIGATGRWLGSSGSAPQWNAPAALTKTDDTNVTLTLGGSASTALLNAASLTLGWTGTLAVSRGGTGTGTAFTAGSVIFAGASGVYAQDNSQFFWDDTNNKLGIGTSSPNSFAAKLVVTGDAVICDREFNSRVASSLANGERGFFQETDGSTEFQIYSPNGGGCVTNIRGVEAMRVHTSRGVSINNTTDPGAGNLRVTGSVLVNAVAGVGYTTGAGGTVTQGAGSGKATTITLDKVCGKVTLNNANLNAGASVSFLLNNNTVTIDDVVTVSFDASLASVDANYTLTNSVGSGQVYFTLKNVSGGNLAQAVKFNFAVIKAATS